jgi:serine/threonine-protein kinase
LIYDTITLSDGQAVLEEYISGVTVGDVMLGGKYRYLGAKRVLISVCNALSVLHERSIIHRDLKPENVMISDDGRVILIDFNAARQMSSASKDTVIMGTVGYASPEQLGLSQSDPRTDIYALGVLIYQLAVGKLPFTGTNQEVLSAHVSKKMPVGDIPHRDLRRIVEKATQKKQEKRFNSAAEFIVALEQISTSNYSIDDSKRMSISGGSDNNALPWVLAAVAGLFVGLILKIIMI